jgi:hypothetical protein
MSETANTFDRTGTILFSRSELQQMYILLRHVLFGDDASDQLNPEVPREDVLLACAAKLEEELYVINNQTPVDSLPKSASAPAPSDEGVPLEPRDLLVGAVLAGEVSPEQPTNKEWEFTPEEMAHFIAIAHRRPGLREVKHELGAEWVNLKRETKIGEYKVVVGSEENITPDEKITNLENAIWEKIRYWQKRQKAESDQSKTAQLIKQYASLWMPM